MLKMKGALSRIKACSVGRGMFLFRSRRYYPTRTWHIAPLKLEVHTSAGERLGPSQGLRDTFELEWPEFHNGVAAALEMDHSGADLDSHWLFHGQGSSPNATHAGFLLGIGFLGKISSLGKVHAWRYLVNRHNLTSLAVVLGLAGTYVRSRDPVAFTLLSIQLPAFLPPGSTSLNIPFQTQAAGLLGIGLVFLGSHQRTKADVLLREMVPPELESRDLQASFREGHALAAGLALGLVMLGRARDESFQSQADLLLIQKLEALMDGRPIDDRTISSERHVAIGITSTPATICLALIFLRSNRADVADRIVMPLDSSRIDETRPDLLLARALARSLIMWDSIAPTKEWLESSLPAFMRNRDKTDMSKLTPMEEATDLAYLNVRMGLCFALGLKYAGQGADSPALSILREEMSALIAQTRRRGEHSRSMRNRLCV